MKGFEIWMYRGIIAVLLMISWYFIRVWAKRIEEKFDTVIKTLQDMGLKNKEQTMLIQNLMDNKKSVGNRLNDHSKRIRNLELDTAKIKRNE